MVVLPFMTGAIATLPLAAEADGAPLRFSA